SSFFVVFVVSKYQKLNDKISIAKIEVLKNKDVKSNDSITTAIEVVPKEKIEIKAIGMMKLMITAKYGDSWLAYKIDHEKIVKFILKHGRSKELEGNKIRLMIGNSQVIQIIKDGIPFLIEKKTQTSTAHLIFPEKLKGHYKPPYFVFNDNDGSVMTTRQYDEKAKGI
ncbi:MAG: hypothetical protein Q7U04_00690, partial [Bacteriovorax sp.]|nr:hypothetical protein [Bacteriovorax sp.]